MSLLRRILNNHVLANLTFLLVLVLGLVSYLQMPRAQDPQVNFNWINIITFFPGASAEDVERRITDPIEDSLESTVQDMRFVSSTSRPGISNILVRFNQLDQRTFDKRLIDLRREVQNTYTDQLPEEAEDPIIYEATTSNAYPSASIAVTSAGGDENLRRQAHNIKLDLERIKGVDRVTTVGTSDPELHIAFYPDRLEGLGITPADISDTVRAYFRDVSAGDVETRDGKWIVRVEGTHAGPEQLVKFPVVTARGVVPLGNLADIYRSREETSTIVRFNHKPAVLLSVTKQADTNVLDLLDEINRYIKQRDALSVRTGVNLFLVDDQTVSTREAIRLMQTNALIGLFFVLLVTWVFLGTRISILTSIGIPFTLMGTFIVLHAIDYSLNNTVLLGVVIALGMLVDDAVVVVESIYQRLQQGMHAMQACIDSFREVFAPVTTSVITTMAAFLPLMLLPGVLGSYMKVIPLVVTLALAISLLEAYWMLPVHVIGAGIHFRKKHAIQVKREAFTHWVRLRYTQFLLKAMRYPARSLAAIIIIFILAAAAVASGLIRFNFFEADPIRLFYVNVEMHRGASLEETTEKLLEVQKKVLARIYPEELRASIVYAGQQFTETEPLFGDTVGQLFVSLNPQQRGGRHVTEITDEVEKVIKNIHGTENISILRMSGGPPVSKAINVKVRGDDYAETLAAANHLMDFMHNHDVFSNVSLDYRPGNQELVLRLDGDAIKRAGISPAVVNRALQAYADGELVAEYQNEGEEVKVRVLAKKQAGEDIDDFLRNTLSLPGGGSIALGDLVIAEHGRGQDNIRHYNFRRTITVTADIDKARINTIKANNIIKAEWDKAQTDFPDVSLDFSGILDDIQETIDSIWILFVLGLGLIYLILGTQFRSYWQPFMILMTVPLAFTGVVLGLLVTSNPLSLFTLYGVVALAGISVNAAIVLITAANDRLQNGMSLLHATVYAARRRVIPILITSLTTIAGLFSLATGLGGHSLIWGPVATAIVWGLAFSTALTLIVIPLLYRMFMGRSFRLMRRET